MNAEAIAHKLVRGLILLGTVSLVYYRRVSANGAITASSITYRSDFVFAAAVAIAIAVGAVSFRTRPFTRSTPTRIEQIVCGALILYFLSASLATVIAALRYHLWFDFLGLGEFLKTILALSLFGVAYTYLKSAPSFFRSLALALALPWLLPLALGVVYLSDPIHWAYTLEGFLSFGGRLQALTSNPQQVATGSLVSLAFVWAFVVQPRRNRQSWGVAAGLLYATGLSFLTIWTISRSGLAVLPVVVALPLLILRTPVRRAAKMVGLLGTSVALSFILLPYIVQPHIVVKTDRSLGISPNVQTRVEAGGNRTQPQAVPSHIAAKTDQSLRILTNVQTRVEAGVDRIRIWRYYISAALSNPLGVGFNYEQRFSFPNPYQPHINAEDNLLTAWMFGGVFAVLGLLSLLAAGAWRASEVIRHKRDSAGFPIYVGVVTALTAIWLMSTFFGVPLQDYTHSLLLAMLLAGVSDPASVAKRPISDPPGR